MFGDVTFAYPWILYFLIIIPLMIFWYWKKGKLTNDKDEEREFPYLHFMHWKGGDWPRRAGNAQWEELDKVVHLNHKDSKNGFRINEKGFFKI